MRVSLLLLVVPQIAAAQRSVEGTVYDSLLHAPLPGADVWVRGSERHAETGSDGRFRLDSVAPGRYTLFVSHPGLDSAGLFTLAVPITITADPTPVYVATPSLATLWRRRCGQEVLTRSDSSLIFGFVQDAKTRAHLAGAGVLLQWLRIVQTDPVHVVTQPRDLTVKTDSTGTYYACGVASDMKVALRAYAQHDSSGLVDLRPGETTWVNVTLGPLPLTLAPVRVVGQASRMLSDFEERRRAGSGLGYFRGEAEIAAMASMRSVLSSMPTIQLVRGQGNTDFMALLPNPGIGGRGWCLAALYVDGFQADWDQLQTYKPKDLVGVEMYPRASSAPVQYQQVSTGCGVVLVWTKYLK